MAFLEKKLNKWLAGFLLGKVESRDKSDDGVSSASPSPKKTKRNVWTRTSDFFKSGIKEMEKELWGPMEDISVKKDT